MSGDFENGGTTKRKGWRGLWPEINLAETMDLDNEETVVGSNRGVSLLMMAEQWQQLQKDYIIVKDLDSQSALSRIRDVVTCNDKTIHNYEGLAYSLPSRTPDQVEFVDSLKQLCLKRQKGNTCAFGDLKSSRKAIVITAVLSIVQDALLDGFSMDCRSVYYRNVELFQNQETSDNGLLDVCCLLECSRHCLNVDASPKGAFIGPISIQMLGGYVIGCDMKSIEGVTVPMSPGNILGIVPTLEKGEKEEDKIKFILVVEKRTVFHYLTRRGFHSQFNCIIITGGGQPDVATRSLLSRLSSRFKVPVYGFVDPDPHGLSIYCTYKFGSEKLSFDNLGLTTFKLEWIGLDPSNLLQLNAQSRLPLSSSDKSILNGLMKKGYIRQDGNLRSAITYMLQTGFKGEVEALNDKGMGTLYNLIADAINQAKPHVQVGDAAGSQWINPNKTVV